MHAKDVCIFKYGKISKNWVKKGIKTLLRKRKKKTETKQQEYIREES